MADEQPDSGPSGASPSSPTPPETAEAPKASGPDASAPPWVFAGWGNATNITDLEAAIPSVGYAQHHVGHKLGQWRATAICGNDITSSVLYVAALCTLAAGVYAPIALATVGVVLCTVTGSDVN